MATTEQIVKRLGKLKSTLLTSGIQQTNQPLYQIINQLIQAIIDSASDVLVISENIDPTPGAQGAAGPIGPPGLDGQDGQDGYDGVIGSAGAQGIPGTRGPAGTAVQGLTGEDGEDGLDGFPGPIGPTGSQGLQGLRGLQGIPGPQGLDAEEADYPYIIPGIAGAAGAAGSIGPTGLTGATGAAGIPGLDAEEPEIPYIIPGPRGATGATGATGGVNVLRKTANQTINAGAATFVDITDLTFPVVNGVAYAFQFYIVFQSALGTTGWKAGVNCPTGTLDFWAGSQTVVNAAAGSTTHTIRHNTVRDDMTLLTSTVTAGVDLACIITGRYLCTADGTFAARFANELAADTNIVVQRGSWGTWF